MFRIKNWLVGIPVALFLSGCSLPPTLKLASYALDGFSLLVSGKSVSDHAISGAMNKDCKISRVIAGREVCEDRNDDVSPTTEVAALSQNDNWNGDAAIAAAAGPRLELVVQSLKFNPHVGVAAKPQRDNWNGRLRLADTPRYKLELAVSTPRLGTEGAMGMMPTVDALTRNFWSQSEPRDTLPVLNESAAGHTDHLPVIGMVRSSVELDLLAFMDLVVTVPKMSAPRSLARASTFTATLPSSYQIN